MRCTASPSPRFLPDAVSRSFLFLFTSSFYRLLSQLRSSLTNRIYTTFLFTYLWYGPAIAVVILTGHPLGRSTVHFWPQSAHSSLPLRKTIDWGSGHYHARPRVEKSHSFQRAGLHEVHCFHTEYFLDRICGLTVN